MPVNRIWDIQSFQSQDDIKPEILNERFNRLYEKWNELEFVTVDPNTVRTAKRGYSVLFYDGTNYFISVNVDSAKTWKKTAALA